MSKKTVKTQKEKARFEKTCPNCGGPISDIRLQKGLPCSKCLPQQVENEDKACEVLLKENKLNKDFKEICTLKEELEKFRNFFFEIHRSYPWSLQEAWFKRFFLGRSFALLAPTGIGKTTFGLTLSYYLAKKKNKKSYLIFPTRLLVEQAINKLRKMGVPEEYLLYFGEKPSLTKKQKEERFRRLEEGDFRILITTSMFLYRNIDKIPKGVYELIFVDDVDSFLKTAKNIDKALYLLGFTEKEIEWALKIIKLRKELAQKPNVSPEEWEKLRKEEEKLKKHAEKVRKGVLIVSSATSNPRSERIKLFRELLGFEVGRPLFYLRNVVDSYEDKFLEGKKSLNDHKPLWDFVADFVKQHPKGGLIYISQDRGKEEVDRLVEYLNSKGLNVRSYEELDKHLKDYEEGKVNAFVGIASYRNPLARGFDMPHVVRYALFVGVPKLKFTLKVEEHISHILWALVAIRPLIAKDKELREKYLQKLDRWIERLRKYSYLSEEFIRQNERLKEIIENIRNEVREFIENPEILERIKESDEITLRWNEKEGYSLIVADVTGYLQASGRTSRLYAGGLTKGFSLVLVDDTKAFNNLRKKVKWFSEEIEFIPLKEVDLKTLFEEIEKDRQKVLRFLKGEIPEEVKELIKPVLVIVESPNKARTIANFFGKPLRRRVGDIDVLEVSLGDKFLTITASAGHVYDLIKEQKKYRNTFHGVIVEPSKQNPEHFIPIYEPIKQETPEGEIRNKEEIINSLRQAGLEVAEVYIGTDPDSITGDSKVLVKVDGEIKHLTVEELFELLKEEYKVELRNGHEYIKPTDLWVPVVDKNYRVRFGKAKYLIRHKVKKPIYKITTQSGREIKITGDHSIFRLDENLNLEEVKPTQLREGDFIVVNSCLPEVDSKELQPKKGFGRKIGNIFEDKIIKIEQLPLEEQYVYDFETETQNFIANNILCHNTEGEKIAWDLYEVIKPYNPNIRRMEFHEVTKRAIVEAIHNPRQIDINLVEAQMVRRIADRWVGFELSRLLQEHFKKPWLSAGRVQTPVLGWVIERDKLYRTKKGAVFVYLPNPQKDKRRISVSWEFEDKKLAREFYKNLTEVEVKILQKREEEKKPAPPFTTDAMLKEASDKLRFSASKTMQLAQELFETGLSTYHRTDSTRVSDVGISIAREYIDENFGQDYFYPRHWGEGGAHECIRPTHPWDVEELRSMMLAGQLKGLTKDHLRLYELIFKRFMASQMRPATVEVSKFEVKPLLEKKDFSTQSVEKEEITSLLRDGFNLMTPIEVYYLKEGTFKVVEQKDLIDEEGNKIGEHSESAMKIYKLVPLAYPYTQGSLIEEMKKRGIGRPSTYAQIVQKLLDRGYVIERKNFLFPTKLGKEVYNYLIRLKEAEKFVKEEFTRILEELMDRIERGEVYYIEVLKDLYEEVLRLEKIKEIET